VPEEDFACSYANFRKILIEDWTKDYVAWCGFSDPEGNSKAGDFSDGGKLGLYILNGVVGLGLLLMIVKVVNAKNKYELSMNGPKSLI
jgi:hypothetical protein